ncbi:MAG: hypothetical protein QM687_09810 [Ferruginibacter sp.]
MYKQIISKLLLLVLVISGLPAFAQADTATCGNFKKGKFVYRNDSAETVIITRRARQQEEYNKTTDVLTKFKVKWLSDCSYQLKQVWSNSKKQRKNNGATTVVTIDAVNADGYEFHCDCKGEEGTRNNGKVFRLSES